MAEKPKEGFADITPEELEIAKKRTHKKDVPKEINRFLNIFKIALKTKKQPKGRPKERVNWYKFSEVSDGWMVKYEIEGFTGGKSMGTRAMKFYVNTPKKNEIEKFVDEFPKRMYQDTRSFKSRERPLKKFPRQNPEDMLLNLDDIWDLDKLNEMSKRKQDEENKDVWAV